MTASVGDSTEAKTTHSTTIHLEKEHLGDQKANSPIISGRPPEIVEDGMDGCPAWYPDWDRLDTIKPKIKLDNTKFVIPILTYGPNNQLRGFR